MTPSINENITLDLSMNRSTAVVYCRQGETNGRTINANITHKHEPIDMDRLVFAEILINKPDGTQVREACIKANNCVKYTIRTNDVAAVGEAEAQIILTFVDGAVMPTPIFGIVVAEKIMGDVPASTNDYDSMNQILAQVASSEDMARGYAEEARGTSELVKTYIENIPKDTQQYIDEANAILDATRDVYSNAAGEAAAQIENEIRDKLIDQGARDLISATQENLNSETDRIDQELNNLKEFALNIDENVDFETDADGNIVVTGETIDRISNESDIRRIIESYGLQDKFDQLKTDKLQVIFEDTVATDINDLAEKKIELIPVTDTPSVYLIAGGWKGTRHGFGIGMYQNGFRWLKYFMTSGIEITAEKYDKRPASIIVDYPNTMRSVLALGRIANSANGTMVGTGVATIFFLDNHNARIDYTYVVTTEGTNTQDFYVGLNRDLLEEHAEEEIPLFNTIRGGSCMLFDDNGTVNKGLNGFGMRHGSMNQFWAPGRCYLADESVGLWADSQYRLGMRVTGTCYGTF